MDKTKELIETWKEYDRYLDKAERGIYFMEDNYCDSGEDFNWTEFHNAMKELKRFKDLREKINELINSLDEGENA